MILAFFSMLVFPKSFNRVQMC